MKRLFLRCVSTVVLDGFDDEKTYFKRVRAKPKRGDTP